MAERVLTDCKLWLDGYDLSGDMNALALAYAAELRDNTTFGDDTRSRIGGLKTLNFAHEGLWNGGDDQVDDVLFARVGVSNTVMTVSPMAGADGEVAYLARVIEAEYSPGADIGEVFSFAVSGEATDRLVNGTIMVTGAKTASGNGTARQLGALSAAQTLYAALHVTAASGTSPTLDVKVQSDDASGFASPTDRITFAQKTAIGAEWATVAGAITDDWWRISYTIGGTGPSFTFVVVVGIL